jgi:uncharacterized protein
MSKIPNMRKCAPAESWDFGFGIRGVLPFGSEPQGRRRISDFGFWIFPSLLFVSVLVSSASVSAAETIPPSPSPNYIVDQSHVIDAATFQSVDQQLQQFERDTSNQIVVGVYPTMKSDDDIAAYAVRVYQAWHIGQKGKDNGALLLVFTQDHKADIATGYGLEGALPDATCKQIIDQEMVPRFKMGDYSGGVSAAVTAMMAATRGEYQGNGTTHLDQQSHFQLLPTLFVIFIALIVLSGILRTIYGTTYSSNGRVPGWVIPFILFSDFTSSGRGGGGSGGGWGGGGGGGFSGGGGSTGGGGASGSW